MPRFRMNLTHKFNCLQLCALLLFVLVIVALVCSNVQWFSGPRHSRPQTDDEVEDKRRVIRYECLRGMTCGGWADRLKGLMSAYALALLLDRRFEVRHLFHLFLIQM